MGVMRPSRRSRSDPGFDSRPPLKAGDIGGSAESPAAMAGLKSERKAPCDSLPHSLDSGTMDFSSSFSAPEAAQPALGLTVWLSRGDLRETPVELVQPRFGLLDRQ